MSRRPQPSPLALTHRSAATQQPPAAGVDPTRAVSRPGRKDWPTGKAAHFAQIDAAILDVLAQPHAPHAAGDLLRGDVMEICSRTAERMRGPWGRTLDPLEFLRARMQALRRAKAIEYSSATGWRLCATAQDPPQEA